MPVLDTDFRNGIGHHVAHYEQEHAVIGIFDTNVRQKASCGKCAAERSSCPLSTIAGAHSSGTTLVAVACPQPES